MLLYVVVGGMTATTWVQVSKAVLMFVCSLLLSALVLWRLGGAVGLFEAAGATARGPAVFMPSPALQNPWEVLSLGVGLTLGLLGLPHVLMRFFTVPDTHTARRSAGLAGALIALFFSLNIVIGYGALALVAENPAYLDASGRLLGGSNMAAVHLAHTLGGNPLEGFVAAVALATILAVVAGLAMSGAGTLAHDFYAQVFSAKPPSDARKLWVSRVAALGLGLLAMALSTLVQHLNIAFLMGLAFAVAASSHFPVLLLSLFWRGFTPRGAIAAGLTGSFAALSCIMAGPTVWVAMLGNEAPLFPLENPALVSVPVALLAGFVGSRWKGPHRGAV
jgi:cation/acetate symporter